MVKEACGACNAGYAWCEVLDVVHRDGQGREYCVFHAPSGRGELSPALDVREAADFIVSSWEGAVTRMKAAKDARPLPVFERTVFGMLLR